MTLNNALDLLIVLFMAFGLINLLAVVYELWHTLSNQPTILKDNKSSVLNKMVWRYALPWLIASILIIIKYLIK
jgi:hypothetical protein